MDTAMVGGQMSRLDEALGSYMDYKQQKEEKLAELGSMSKIDRMTEAISKVQEGVSGAGDTAMAVSQFGTAMLEKKGVAGLKGLLAKYRGRGGGRAGEEPEAEGRGAEAPAQAPVQPEISGTRVPEGFTRMRGGAVGEAEEMGEFSRSGYSYTPRGEYIPGSAGPRAVPEGEGEPAIQMRGITAEDFDQPAQAPRTEPTTEGGYEYTGRAPEVRAAPATEVGERLTPTYSAQDIADMGRESRAMKRAAQVSSRERGLGGEGEPSFRYRAPIDPEGAGRSMAERYAGAGEEGYGGMRGSSLIARATRQAPDPMSAIPEQYRYGAPGEAPTSIPQPQGEVSFQSYRPQAERMATERAPRPTPEPAEAPRVPEAAQVEQRVGAADVEAGGDIARTTQLQDVAVRRIAALRGEETGGGTGGDAALDESTAGNDEEVGSLLDTIGGWSGALNVLGGVGMLAGLGGAIYGGIEAGKEETEEQSAIRSEQALLSRPTNVNFGSLALPTYDTSAMRGGGGMGHF